MSRQRLDWVEFFRRVPEPHGVRIRLVDFDSNAPEGQRLEKRLVRLVKARSGAEPFALRRSYAAGPPIIDCVFSAATPADELAGEIGAVPAKPPLGWRTARELVADAGAARRILKIGREACLPRARGEDPSIAAAPASPPRNSTPRALLEQPSSPDAVGSETSSTVGVALERLAKLSPDEQASALFKSMMEGIRQRP